MGICFRCQIRHVKHGHNLCELCEKNCNPSQKPTFEKFERKYLKEDHIKGLFYADDALLVYEDYRDDVEILGNSNIFPLLEGPYGQEYKKEHKNLQAWFLSTFFDIVKERLDHADSRVVQKSDPEKVKKNFCAFRQVFYQIYRTAKKEDSPILLPEFDRIVLLLKKTLVKLKKDPFPVDTVAQIFDPGSALFLLELYVTLQDFDLLDSLQHKITRKKPQQLNNYIKFPSLILLPWDHQNAAFNAWSQGGKKGIIVMATATGKTLVGLMAIEALAMTRKKTLVRVIANSRALLNQWKRQTVEKLGIRYDTSHDYNVPVCVGEISIYYETIQKVCSNPRNYSADLVIFDEVHHFSGPEFRKGFEIHSPQKIGLSATVEGEIRLATLRESLGPVLFEFSLKDALTKGIIPSFLWKVIPVNLDVEEEREFKGISHSITSLFLSVKNDVRTIKEITGKTLKLEGIGEFISLTERARSKKIDLPDTWKQLQALILKRRWIIHKSKPRIDDAIRLTRSLSKDHKIIVFAMDTETCDYIGKSLKKDHLEHIYVIHSKIQEEPHALIERFRQAKHGVLIGAQMLSEGIDIPDADIGINVASSKTRLQLTQRMGRILRKGKDKSPVFYHYVAIPEKESYIADEDDEAFLDDLAWVQDTALKMGLDAEVIWNDEALYNQGKVIENSFHNRFFKQEHTTIPKYGTFKLNQVMGQLSDHAGYRITSVLKQIPPHCELKDAEWSRIVQTSLGKEKNELYFDVPGFWWILILGNRNPEKILAIFSSFRPKGDYRPDGTDKRVIFEMVKDLTDRLKTPKTS